MAQYFDQFSRPVHGAIFAISFAGQLVNRWFLMALRLHAVQSSEVSNNVLLVGGGPLVQHFCARLAAPAVPFGAAVRCPSREPSSSSLKRSFGRPSINSRARRVSVPS